MDPHQQTLPLSYPTYSTPKMYQKLLMQASLNECHLCDSTHVMQMFIQFDKATLVNREFDPTLHMHLKH